MSSQRPDDDSTDDFLTDDFSEYEEQIRELKQDEAGREEIASVYEQFITEELNDASPRWGVRAIESSLSVYPEPEVVARATGLPSSTVERISRSVRHEKRRHETTAECPILSEVQMHDTEKGVADTIRYYFDEIVENHWLETASYGLRAGEDRTGIDDAIRPLESRPEFDLTKAEKVAQLATGLQVRDAILDMRANEVRQKCLTVLEAALAHYVDVGIADSESVENTVAKVAIQFPRVADMDGGEHVIARAVGVDVDIVYDMDVHTNAGGVEIDPIRRNVVERDRGTCVRCDEQYAVVHRVHSVDEIQPTRPDLLACLCERCYSTVFEYPDHRRRYEMADVFWEWTKSTNTTLPGSQD